MKMSTPKYMFVSSYLVLFLCIPVFCSRENSSSLRATCDPIYRAVATNHTMCLDDAANSSPAPFSAQEAQVLVDLHNAFRAEERNASGMMKVVWDADIAAVAQKWAQQCGQAGENERHPDIRSVPSLHGIKIGQNVAALTQNRYTYKMVSYFWYYQRAYFEYGHGSVNGQDFRKYAQMVFEDVARIGCGRAKCTKSGRYPWRNIVCNYAGAPTLWNLRKPYTFCGEATCKTDCLERDSSGLCDCKGKVCLNGGTLNKTTCTCTCPKFVSGGSCETVACGSVADTSYCNKRTKCQFARYFTNCPDMCTCKLRKRACSKVCQNGGTQNTLSCTCNCPDGWTGDVCEVSA